MKKVGPARGTGTSVYFHPDPTIFPRIEFDPALIAERLEVASYLHRGLRLTFDDQSNGTKTVFEHEEGLAAFLAKIVAERGAKPVHEAAFALARDNGLRVDLVLQWTEATDEHVRSYVNGVPTTSGGTHEDGLRAGLSKAVRNFIETHNLAPKGVTIAADDIREGLTGVVSVFIQEPQFQGQTKDRLNNPELLSAVDGVVRPALEHWLNHTWRSSLLPRVLCGKTWGVEWDYLSPHLDDVALSCGGLVWEQAQQGEKVEVWTVCAGDAPAGPMSPFAEGLRLCWKTGREAVSQRRAEDKLSCELMGASVRHFDIPDCIYRRAKDDSRPLYDSDTAIFGPLHPAEEELVDFLVNTPGWFLKGQTWFAG